MKAKCHNLMDTPKQIIANDNRYITTTYSVFPGIEFSFIDVHDHQIINEKKSKGDHILEITYCREGRSEFNMNDEFVFLAPGDLMIVDANTVSPVMNFPLKHYHGLTVSIDLDKTPHCLSCFLEDVNVQPKSLAEKFCGDRIGYIARANQSIKHIFSEIYSVSEHMLLAVTLHNIPEGMAVGVVYAGFLTGNGEITAAGALALSLGIAIQNFPEGAIISMPLQAEGMKKGRAFLSGVLSGVVEAEQPENEDILMLIMPMLLND